ncbi:hypothetical protein MMC13_006683 [Lambiella insularis]|nr:hypothetical protein [Lambiella insularis]
MESSSSKPNVDAGESDFAQVTARSVTMLLVTSPFSRVVPNVLLAEVTDTRILDLIRGESAASAMEFKLSGLERRIDDLLASMEDKYADGKADPKASQAEKA